VSHKKTITLTNYEGHQHDPNHGTPWSDTWVTFHVRRRRVTIGPCILTVANAEGEYDLFGMKAEFPDGDWVYCLPYGDAIDGMPDIAVNAPLITKGHIEGAVCWYLRELLGVTAELKIRWSKHDCPIITPVQLGAPDA
jgi:hypothetical protein